MKLNKILIPLMVIGLLAVSGTILVKQAQADDTDYGPNGVVERLTERFNLNQDEVEQTLNQYREERRAENQAQHEERLQQVVDDGVITAEQKQAIIDKHEEMMHNRGQMREEMQSWMDNQGIDWQALSTYGCGEEMGGPKGQGFRGR